MLSRTENRFRPWALIAQKRFDRAKRRLSGELDAEARRSLARAMFERVLGCTRGAELAGVLVATDGADVARLATRRGAHVLHDASDSDAAPALRGAAALPLTSVGLARVIDDALAWLTRRDASHALVLMADLPLIMASDVRELRAAARQHELVIAPDAQRRGTNALALPLDRGLRTAFGHADSFSRHLRAAERAALTAHVLVHPRLAFDLDSPQELARNRYALGAV